MAQGCCLSGLRETLLGLDAVHSAGMAYGTGGYLDGVKDKMLQRRSHASPEAYKEQVHPAVIAHAETGRPALYLNPVYTQRIAGWSEGRPGDGLLGHVSSTAASNREFHLAPALGEGHACHLGQSRDAAFRAHRLSRSSPRNVKNLSQGHKTESGTGMKLATFKAANELERTGIVVGDGIIELPDLIAPDDDRSDRQLGGARKKQGQIGAAPRTKRHALQAQGRIFCCAGAPAAEGHGHRPQLCRPHRRDSQRR